MAIETGSNVTGKVTNITNFGAFVELEGNKTGLIHISEITDHYVKDINDEVERNQEVEVKVLKIEDNGNIALSLKQANSSQTDSKPQHKDTHKDKSHSHSENKHGGNARSQSRPKHSNNNRGQKKEGFDDLMSDFLKSSEDRLSSLKRNAEGKRGGRGGRRG